MSPSVFRILIKDVVDFLVVFLFTVIATLAVYYAIPTIKPVPLSLYFFEQFIELFFVNPRLLVWFFSFGLGISIIYYLFCVMLHQTTLGGLLTRIRIYDKKTKKPLALTQAILMAVGAFFGVAILLLGPLSAWWLDAEYRGWSEKWAGTIFLAKQKMDSSSKGEQGSKAQ